MDENDIGFQLSSFENEHHIDEYYGLHYQNGTNIDTPSAAFLSNQDNNEHQIHLLLVYHLHCHHYFLEIMY
jgi:hypothetical protein